MKRLCILALSAGLAAAQRSKPVFDPETREGLLIEHIEQERDSDEKLRYMEQFAVQFPSHPAIAWVYDQLQPAFLKVKEYEQAMRIGSLRLAIEPGNLDAAKIALRAAEAKRDQEAMLKWAERSWDVAAHVTAKRPQDADAKQLQTYAEYCLHKAAADTADPKVRIGMLEALDRRNPQSAFAGSMGTELYQAYTEAGDAGHALQIAEQIVKSDPSNADMLLAVAQHHFRKEDSREKVIQYTTALIKILETKSAPEGVSSEAWEKRKAQMLGAANYMGGVSASLLNQHLKADVMLRAALPSLNDDPQMLATTLYLLGLANYRLAESGGRTRAIDALRFTQRCAAIRSSYQEQAIKNAAAIKVEYNLQQQ